MFHEEDVDNVLAPKKSIVAKIISTEIITWQKSVRAQISSDVYYHLYRFHTHASTCPRGHNLVHRQTKIIVTLLTYLRTNKQNLQYAPPNA